MGDITTTPWGQAQANAVRAARLTGQAHYVIEKDGLFSYVSRANLMEVRREGWKVAVGIRTR